MPQHTGRAIISALPSWDWPGSQPAVFSMVFTMPKNSAQVARLLMIPESSAPASEKPRIMSRASPFVSRRILAVIRRGMVVRVRVIMPPVAMMKSTVPAPNLPMASL